jgi:hypothetical protein
VNDIPVCRSVVIWVLMCVPLTRFRVAKVQKEYDTYAQDKAELLESEKHGLEQRLAVERAEKVAEMSIRIEKMWQMRIKRELDVRVLVQVAFCLCVGNMWGLSGCATCRRGFPNALPRHASPEAFSRGAFGRSTLGSCFRFCLRFCFRLCQSPPLMP